MSAPPRYTYDATTKHLKDALRQPEFEVRLPEYEFFTKIRRETAKDGRSYTSFGAKIQHNPSHPVDAPEPYYGCMTILQLVSLFGDSFPSWIQLKLTDEDREFGRSEFKDMVQGSDVSDFDLPSLSPTYSDLRFSQINRSSNCGTVL